MSNDVIWDHCVIIYDRYAKFGFSEVELALFVVNASTFTVANTFTNERTCYSVQIHNVR